MPRSVSAADKRAADKAVTRPVHEGLFRGGDAEPARLVAGRCLRCGQLHFPLSSTCPYCSEAGTEEVELSGPATLWAWTAVTAPPPGYAGEVPFGFGVVQMEEGLRLVTRLTETDPGRLSFGQRMHLEIVALHTTEDGTEVVTYAFAPEGGDR
jgi:uncharacterized OB-fold protein